MIDRKSIFVFGPTQTNMRRMACDMAAELLLHNVSVAILSP